MRTITKYLLIFVLLSEFCLSQNLTVYDIVTLDNPSPGYIFTGPVNGTFVALYDNSGNPCYYKDFKRYGSEFNALRILENGYFAFISITSRKWYIVDTKFNVIDSIEAVSPHTPDFHTLHYTDKGNYLLIEDQVISVNMKAKVPNGNPNAQVTDNIIMELDKNKNVVFSWSCYEHIDITDMTEDLSLTETFIDPYHANSVYYDTDGNLLADFRNLDEVIKINRRTGDIIWIWGGSKSKKNQFTFFNDTDDGFTGFSHQHDPKRLDNGNILLYDNGDLRPTPYSRAVEYKMDESAKTVTKVWEFRHSPDIFGLFMGNAQRLPNGNTMIGWGSNARNPFEVIGTEVTPDGKIVFEFSSSGKHGNYQVLRHVYKMNAVSLSINSTGNYNFNDPKNQTGINLDITSINGTGFTSIEKHDYKPYDISYSSLPACDYLPYRWVINNNGISKITGKIYLDLNSLENVRQMQDLKFFWRANENSGTFKLLETTYNQQNNRIEANINDFGEYFVGYTSLFTPIAIYPSNGLEHIPLDASFKWLINSTDETSRIQVSETEKFSKIVFDSIGIIGKQDVSGSASCQIKLNLLKNLTRYFWRIKTYNYPCESKWSDINSFETIIETPALMSPLDNSSEQPLSGYLSWSYVKGAEKLIVQISEDLLFDVLIVNDTIASGSSFNYLNLKPWTKYYWRVAAGSKGFYGSWSDIFSFKTDVGKVILNNPVNFKTGNCVFGTLNWYIIHGINNYEVQISTDSNFTQINCKKIISTNIFDYLGLENSKLYFWRVRGILKDTVTAWSDTWNFKTIIGKPQLKEPLNNASGISLRGNLNWFSVDEAVEYQIQLATDNKFQNLILNRVSDSLFISYSSLEFKKLYYWRVRAYDGEFYGDWQDYRTFETINQLIYPKNCEYKISTSPKFQWFKGENAESYEIRVSQDSLFTKVNNLISNIPDTCALASELANNSSYFWSIREKKKSNYCNWTQPNKFTTLLSPPRLLFPSNDANDINIEVQLKWEEVEGAEYYHIQISPDSTFEQNIADKEEISFTFYDSPTLLPDTKYYWRMLGYNSINLSDWSSIGVFKTISTTNVEETSLNDIQFDIYPLPVNSFSRILISPNQPGVINLAVLDVFGNVLQTIVNRSLEPGNHIYDLSVDDLPQGVYFCRLTTESGIHVKKFQVVK
jgi:hypothetical protein